MNENKRVLVSLVEDGETREVTSRFIGHELVVEEFSTGCVTKEMYGSNRRQSIVTVLRPLALAQRFHTSEEGLIHEIEIWFSGEKHLADFMDLLDRQQIAYRYVQQIDSDVIQFVPARHRR